MFPRFFLLAVILIGALGIATHVFWYDRMPEIRAMVSSRIAFAESDDEDEEEEDDEDEEDRNDEKTNSRSSRSVQSKESVITTYRLVEKTVTILDEKFRIDTDGDLLVDGLDPHPTVPESAYFTDDDEDAVPNAVDAYPGKDDFFVFDDEADRDRDGLIDSFVTVTGE